jgi:hypothetical protein
MSCRTCTDLVIATEQEWTELNVLLAEDTPPTPKLAALLAAPTFFEES